MENADLERFKGILEDMLAELKQPLGDREEILIEASADPLEQLQSARDRELAIRRLEADSSRIRDLVDALQRIRDRTFGFCSECETEISVKRLNAVPWASCCLECQRAVDGIEEAPLAKPVFVRAAGESMDLG